MMPASVVDSAMRVEARVVKRRSPTWSSIRSEDDGVEGVKDDGAEGAEVMVDFSRNGEIGGSPRSCFGLESWFNIDGVLYSNLTHPHRERAAGLRQDCQRQKGLCPVQASSRVLSMLC